MRRVRRIDPHPRRSTSPLSRTQCGTPSSPIRPVAASGITALAPSRPQALPLLSGVILEYEHEERAELLYDLCAALVREGLGTVADWKDSKQKCLPFIQRALMRTIGEDRWNLLRRNVEYHLQLADAITADYDGGILSEGRLALMIECSGCGYLKIGPALQALEEESPGLGGAFYWELIHTLYRVMRIYDHDDALQYEASLREMAEDDEEAAANYEFPDVEKSLPQCVQAQLHGDHSKHTANTRRVIARSHGKFKGWFDRLRRMQRLARLHSGVARDYPSTHHYDAPPLPSLLVAFDDRDPITACFDEEGQHMLEGSCEPALLVTFDPKSPEEVRRAHRSAARFILFNEELFALVEDIARTEKSNGHPSVDRTEPSL